MEKINPVKTKLKKLTVKAKESLILIAEKIKELFIHMYEETIVKFKNRTKPDIFNLIFRLFKSPAISIYNGINNVYETWKKNREYNKTKLFGLGKEAIVTFKEDE